MMKNQEMPKLAASLIPANAWGRNVRAVVSEGSWYSIRVKFGASKPAYSAATDPIFLAIRDKSINILDEIYQEDTKPLLCGICGKSVPDGLHLHEKWEFDDERLIQKLVGFIPICEDCHNAIHYGKCHIQMAFDEWKKRRQLHYQLDLSFLYENKLVPERQIHMGWLDRPRKVRDRLDALSWSQAVLDLPNAVILDTETTGLIEGFERNPNAEVVELAIISVKGKTLYNGRFKPRYTIPTHVIDIHGITNQAVTKKPIFPKEYAKILQILHGKIVIAYNSRFDQKIIENTCRIYSLNPPDSVLWACAMWAYKGYQESPQFLRLPNGKHSALSDCKATLKLIKRMSRNEDIPCA
jgi:DNA polymerase-3 subunit epsilon